MGRNVVAQGPPNRSFAGLMDHLTGFSREGASGSHTDADSGASFRRTSKPGTAATDEALTDLRSANPRSAARPMLPVTERKPGRAAPPAEAIALSYEKALQIHGRRRGRPSPPLVQTPQITQSQPAAVPTRKGAIAGARKAATNVKAIASQAKAETEHSKPGLAAARSGVRLRKTAAAAGSIPTAAARAARHATAYEAEDHETSKARRNGKSSAKISREDPEDVSAFRSSSLQSLAPERAVPRERIRLLESAVEVMPTAPEGSPLELLQAFGQLGQPDQRRTIVSVRLTEGEFACLRERAEESGISVSAYMRSCVVDADELRAQVKRALAEIRSLTAAAGSEPRTALTASGHGPSETSGWNAQGWFRLMLRPLASLFGPLFPARRSA